MIALVRKGLMDFFFFAAALSRNGALGFQNYDSSFRPNSSRTLAGSVGSNEPFVYRDCEHDFVLDFYGLTELLTDDDVRILQQTTNNHLNKRLRSSPDEIRVSNVQVSDQRMVENEIPILSISLRIMGQAVSTGAKSIATLSFEDVVLGILSSYSSEFARALKESSDAFDQLLVLVPKGSVLKPDYSTMDSSDKNLVVMISAAVGATVMTAIVLGICLCRQKKGSSVVTDKLEKDDVEDLGIASTWSSSDESSEEAPTTPPKLRSFPIQDTRVLSPCIEEIIDADIDEEAVRVCCALESETFCYNSA